MADDPVKVAFDVAINSLDFSSGFLDNSEVEALRELAKRFGVDPMDATPRNFKPQYCPEHDYGEWRRSGLIFKSNKLYWTRKCKHCGDRQKQHKEPENV